MRTYTDDVLKQIEVAKVDFACELDRLRLHNGLTKQELSQRSGISRQRLHRIFKAEINLTLETMVTLIAACGEADNPDKRCLLIIMTAGWQAVPEVGNETP